MIHLARFALAAAALAITAVAVAADSPARVLEESPGRTLLRLEAPIPAELPPAADARYRRLDLPGFGVETAPGAPRLPVWVGRIAIPAGAAARLVVRSAPGVALPGVRPAPVPGADLLHLPEDGRPLEPGVDTVEVWREDARFYGGPAPWPAAPVELGATGSFRHQRFVEVRYHPAAFDPASGGLLWYPQVVVEVLHAAPEGAVAQPASPPEAAWEPLYQRAFLNHAAGRAMRLPRAARGPEAAGAEAAALTAVFKIEVTADAAHRLGHATLSAAAPALLATDPRTWHLWNRGVEVPIRIVGEEDGAFGTADLLEFVGEARHEPDMVLEVDLAPAPAIYRDLDVGSTNVYLLSASGAPGSGARMATLDGAPDPVTPLPPEPDFVHTARFEDETIFLPLVDDDAWFWGPRTNSLDVGGSTAPATRTMSLDLPGLAPAAFLASLHASFRGTTSLSAVDPDHRLTFTLNGQPLPDLLFDGDGAAALDATVDQALALSDPATLEFTAQPVFEGPTAKINEVILNRVEVTYRRSFAADGGALRFDYPDGDFGFQVTGLPDAGVRVYDLSDTVSGSSVAAPALLTGVQVVQDGPTWTAKFEIHPTGGPARTLLVAAGAGTAAVDAGAVQEDAPSDLRDPANGAGYLLITHPDLVESAGGSAYNAFLAARAAEGLPVFTAYVDDIYDEFADSLPGPEAIRDFLQYVFTSWAGWDGDGDGAPDPPRHVLFLGDGSFDFQERLDYSGLPQGWFNLVPTGIFYQQSTILAWFSSDVWLTSVEGDDFFPEFLTGRLPVRDVAGSEALLQKILAYESAPPAGGWRSHATFLASSGNFQAETDEFERIALELEAQFGGAPFTAAHLLYFTDFGGTDFAGMNAAIEGAIDDGTAFLDYVGHGNFTKWGLATLYLSSDVALQANGGRQPFVVIENCLSGGFAWHFQPAMGEELTLDPDDGAIAAFAPAGLSTTFVGEPVAEAMLGVLSGADKVREVGAITAAGLAALSDRGFIVDMMSYELLGDPATWLTLPAPVPPADPSAVAGVGVVHLAWTASPDPVAGYVVLRTEDLAQPYVAVAGTPVTGTLFDDTTVVNATTYYYAIVAVDTAGFESAWSNQNRDCDVAGPDCLTATPANPFPPSAPAGVGAEPSLGKPDEVRVFWAPNPEGDVAVYRVRYGGAPGGYTGQAEAGPAQTDLAIGDLVTGTPYYFIVEAENTGGLVSAPSAEVSATPRFLLGTRPPAAVAGVQVVRTPGSSTSVDVSWDAVTQDIYGLAETVVAYEIYAGSGPRFVPVIGSPLATVAAPGLKYTHVGAAAAPGNRFYLVVAVDADGLRSALGDDLPNGIMDLGLTLRPDEITVDLAWGAVTETVGGAPAIVSNYEVHGAATPLSVSMLTPATLLGEPAATAFTHVPPVGGVFYYTVIAVDPRGSVSPF